MEIASSARAAGRVGCKRSRERDREQRPPQLECSFFLFLVDFLELEVHVLDLRPVEESHVTATPPPPPPALPVHVPAHPRYRFQRTSVGKAAKSRIGTSWMMSRYGHG